MSFIPIVFYVLSTVTGLVLIKLGSATGAVIELIGGKLSFNLTLVNVLGLSLYAVSFVLYTFLIAKHNLGYIVPLTTGLVYVFVFAASLLVFKEPYSSLKIAGIALILVGVLLLNLPGKQ